jgi:endonuclease YncB( thermonuclease family)
MARMTVASLLQQRDALQRWRLWRCCAFFVMVGSTLSTALAWPGVVTHVSDGDTVWVQPLQGGEAYKVRLLGIDAPEICQPWGPQSRAALHAVLQGQVVEVYARTRDSYGRLLAQLTSQGNDVGAWMVGRGYAWSYSYKTHAGPYEALQVQAQSQHLGLFADGRALQPRWFRKRFGACHLP